MKQVYTIFDKVARKGNNLFIANTQEEAKRIFENSMARWQRENPDFNPSDYTCFYLGLYQDEDIMREGEDGKMHIVRPAPSLNTVEGIDLYDVPLGEELE